MIPGLLCRRTPRFAQRGGPRATTPRRAGYTLIEVLVVVVVLGIAGVLVIPSMSQASVLRVQAAVRTLVADISYVQSEAIAFQSRRVIWFGIVPRWLADEGRWDFVEGNGYVMAEVRGPALNLATDFIPDPDKPTRPLARDFSRAEFGGATIASPAFNGEALLIFDELGGPVAELDGPDPGLGGQVVVQGGGSSFRVDVQAYTGRVTVTRTAAPGQ